MRTHESRSRLPAQRLAQTWLGSNTDSVRSGYIDSGFVEPTTSLLTPQNNKGWAFVAQPVGIEFGLSKGTRRSSSESLLVAVATSTTLTTDSYCPITSSCHMLPERLAPEAACAPPFSTY